MKGLFITFEGIDGCGKSTQIGKLAEYLEKKQVPLLFVREPGGTAIGEKIRNILLDKKSDGMCNMTELLLFEAARAQITEEKIIPATASGTTVLCDRFFDSTVAYQGYARDMGHETVSNLNMLATGGKSPDITFLFDISPEEAFARRSDRGEEDRLEGLGLEFQRRVREGYLEMAKTSDRIKVIDASRSVDEISAEVLGYISEMV